MFCELSSSNWVQPGMVSVGLAPDSITAISRSPFARPPGNPGLIEPQLPRFAAPPTLTNAILPAGAATPAEAAPRNAIWACADVAARIAAAARMAFRIRPMGARMTSLT